MSTFRQQSQVQQPQLQCQSETARILSTRIPRLSSTRIPRLSSTRTPGSRLFVTANSKPSVVHSTQFPPSPIETTAAAATATTSSVAASSVDHGMILKPSGSAKNIRKFLDMDKRLYQGYRVSWLNLNEKY